MVSIAQGPQTHYFLLKSTLCTKSCFQSTTQNAYKLCLINFINFDQHHLGWNLIFEMTRLFSFCKKHFHWKIIVYWKLLKGHQGQDQGQQRPWPPWPLCNGPIRPVNQTVRVHPFDQSQQSAVCCVLCVVGFKDFSCVHFTLYINIAVHNC